MNARRFDARRRYGRVPADELPGYFEQGQTGGTFDPNNTSDMVFADKLADHDDPRELHVRRDISYRGPGATLATNVEDAHRRLAGTPMQHPEEGISVVHPLNDGTVLHVTPYGNDENPTSYAHEWYMDGHHGPHPHSYLAVLTPTEHADVMRRLGIGHDEPEPEEEYDPPGTPTGGPNSPGGMYYARRRPDVPSPRAEVLSDPGEVVKYGRRCVAAVAGLKSSLEKTRYERRVGVRRYGRGGSVHGWVSPKGDYRPLSGPHGVDSHDALIRRLGYGGDSAWDDAFTDGWVRVVDNGGTVYAHNPVSKPTWKQLSELKDLAIQNGMSEVRHLSDDYGEGRVIWSNVDRYERRTGVRRMMRVGDPATHDGMIRQINETRDPSGLGPFADFLEEQGAPGAHLARRAWENSRDPENVSHPFQVSQWWEGDHGGQKWSGENGEDTQMTLSNSGNTEVRTSYNGTTHRGRILVTHPPQVGFPRPERVLSYNVPVESVEDLHHLTSDLPEPMRRRIVEHLTPHLRPAKLSRLFQRRYAAKGKKEVGEALRELAFKLNDELELGPDYQRLFWNPGTKVVWYVTSDSDEEPEVKKVRDALENVPGVDHVRVEAEYFPPDDGSGWFEMYDRNKPDEGWMPWPPKDRKSRRRYAAYRAPAGGMVFRGTSYVGGQMIPDMEGEFANPPQPKTPTMGDLPVRKEEGSPAPIPGEAPYQVNSGTNAGKVRRIDVMRRIAARRKRKLSP